MRDGDGNRLSPAQETAIRRKVQNQPADAVDRMVRSDLVLNIAQKYAVSPDAVEVALVALRRGRGSMAQFSHPDFGGMAQWTAGGMSMVGDMFNSATKAKLDGVLQDLAQALQRGDLPLEAPQTAKSDKAGPDEWPLEFGQAGVTGGQNDMRYAFFPSARRLVIENRGKRTIYDTGGHIITGVSQQQSTGQILSFRSQLGPVAISDLKIVA